MAVASLSSYAVTSKGSTATMRSKRSSGLFLCRRAHRATTEYATARLTSTRCRRDQQQHGERIEQDHDQKRHKADGVLQIVAA
jgi:hypothetical protein